MEVGELLNLSGCFTKEKFIAGRTLADIERVLGFHPGRLSAGMAVAVLLQLPEVGQFELAGYSNVATHRGISQEGLDIQKLKNQAHASWALNGFERLVKVLPVTRHDRDMDPDIQYPPGLGAPQWVATVPLLSKVIAIVRGYPDARFVAVDAGHV